MPSDIADTCEVLVSGKGRSGYWVHEALILPALILSGIVSVIPLVWYLLKWAVVTTITPMTWSWRAATGRWPVVAYTLGARDGDRQSHRAHRRGRAAAQALAEQWQADIKEHGHVRVS